MSNASGERQWPLGAPPAAIIWAIPAADWLGIQQDALLYPGTPDDKGHLTQQNSRHVCRIVKALSTRQAIIIIISSNSTKKLFWYGFSTIRIELKTTN
jgi:hypothetical protein